MVEVIKTEEKAPTLPVARLLVAHAYQGRYQAAIVVSNDSDLVLRIKFVHQDLGLPVAF